MNIVQSMLSLEILKGNSVFWDFDVLAIFMQYKCSSVRQKLKYQKIQIRMRWMHVLELFDDFFY